MIQAALDGEQLVKPGLAVAIRSYLVNSPTVQGALSILTGGRVKYGWWSKDYRSVEKPIVIGGCGRSGTTLMRSILNRHPRIACSQESGVFTSMHCIRADVLGRALGLSRVEIEELYRRASCSPQFVELLYAKYLAANGKVRWAEKDPSSIKAIDRIFNHFPEAKFIHMIRDGRDVVCSLRTHPKWRIEGGVRVPTNILNPWETCIARWVEDTRAGLSWRGDRRYMEVRYEELVSNPTETINDVLDFIGEDWCDEVTEVDGDANVPLTHQEIAAGINSRAQGRWQRDLPEAGRVLFKQAASELLMELGYADEHSW